MISRFTLLMLCLCLFIDVAQAKIIPLDEECSKITYTLTKLKIPFKRKPLNATGEIILDQHHSNNTSQILLSNLNLKANFTSKNPIFRKVIDYDKYPYFMFSSMLEKPELINDGDNINLNGYVTFHGISNKINVNLKCKLDKELIYFSGTLTINMNDFGIKPPKILFISIADDLIKTEIEIQSKFK